MSNLFIVNTPLHLFTAYIIANYYTAGQSNMLALINPKAYSAWENSRCLAKMASDDTTWKSIILGTKDYLRQRVKESGALKVLSEIRKTLNDGEKIDQVYLASDKVIANQILVEMSGNTTYIRFDEGSASYVLQPRRWKTQAAERLGVQFLRLLAGLHSDMKYNFKSIGQGQAGTADYLFKPWMLERPSPKPVAIEREAIMQALDKLTPVMDEYQVLMQEPVILYLGSYQAEFGGVDPAQEIDLLKRLAAFAKTIHCKLLYKPHPGERRDKLKAYQEQLADIEFFHSVEPMEIILYRHGNIRALVTAVSSSAMLYADLFAKQEVRSLSAANLLGWTPKPIDFLFKRSGVHTPETFEELQKHLTS